MFTGIIQSIAIILGIKDLEGLRTITFRLKKSFCLNLKIGASVSVDGVCLTVTKIRDNHVVDFDVMLQSLITTTLSDCIDGANVNVERAAKEGAEIGGHYISGHVDCRGRIIDIQKPQNNCMLRIQVPPIWMRYIFSKGYIAVNGASLTVCEINRSESWFEVWLIPETLRMTTFSEKKINDFVNIEIERGTQVVVDTVRATLEESLNTFLPSLSKLLIDNKLIDEFLNNQITLPSIKLLNKNEYPKK